jgi:hypothetical protein
MSLFQLNAESVVARIRAGGGSSEIPCLGTSLRRGIIGFTVVSVAGFVPWAIAGHWIHKYVGEAGLYAICALSFIATAGLTMHKLIIGPGSLSRFYKLFSLSFAAYSIAWIVGWMSLRGNPGSIAGLLAGTVLMGCILAFAFDAGPEALKIIAALFLLNALGYFGGGWIEELAGSAQWIPLAKSIQFMIARLLWGVCYGIGFGAGLGLAFHLCQTKTRALLNPLAEQRPGNAV